MYEIEVAILNTGHPEPENMMMFLANLTQKGHSIHNMDQLLAFYDECMHKTFKSSKAIAQGMERHGTIKRFSPITVAVVGASRRFLAQIRTHSVGLDFVSASCQYSDYSNVKAEDYFAIPYKLIAYEKQTGDKSTIGKYLSDCSRSLENYKTMAHLFDNDTAGYIMPQGLRNILIIQGNAEAWSNMIDCRTCGRNTDETAITMIKVWDTLLKTPGGDIFFGNCGPDCLRRGCREGLKACHNPHTGTTPQKLMAEMFPYMVHEDSHGQLQFIRPRRK